MILVSIFRNSSRYIDRYVSQVNSLREYIDVKVVAVEGDSTDDTYDLLTAANLSPLKVEHGGPTFSSVNDPQRWRQIACVCNVAMTAAVRILDNEPVIYVESDLLWDADTMLHLAKHTDIFPAVAPMSMHGHRFYDVWGYRKDTIHFNPYPPHHHNIPTDKLITIDSAGSCIAMCPDAARVVEFSMKDCILGVGRSLYANGFSLWLDPTLKVEHP